MVFFCTAHQRKQWRTEIPRYCLSHKKLRLLDSAKTSPSLKLHRAKTTGPVQPTLCMLMSARVSHTLGLQYTAHTGPTVYSTHWAYSTAHTGPTVQHTRGLQYSTHWAYSTANTLGLQYTANTGPTIYSRDWAYNIQHTLGLQYTAHTGPTVYSTHWNYSTARTGPTVQHTLGL